MPIGKPSSTKHTKGAYGGFSLHFKNLHDTEEELEVDLKTSNVTCQNDLEYEEANSSFTDVQSTDALKRLEIQSNVTANTPASLEPDHSQAMDDKNSSEHILKRVDSQSQGVASLLGDIGKKDNMHENESSRKLVPAKSKSTLLVTHLEGVEDHPLLHSVSLSDSDEQSEEPTTSVPRCSMNITRNETLEEVNDRTITKGMLSSAFFDPKARTQLMSTLKKSIQHYTGATSVAKTDSERNARFDSDNPQIEHNISSFMSSDSRMILPQSLGGDSGTVTVFKEREMEPLQGAKRVLEDTLIESGENYESGIRKRSSSENDFIGTGSRYLRKHSGPDSVDIQVSKSAAAVPRSSSMAVSLSNLLAERQESRSDAALSGPTSSRAKALQEEDLGESHEILNSPTKETHTGSQAFRTKSSKDHVQDDKQSPPSVYLLFFLTGLVYLYHALPLPPTVHVALLSFFIGVVCSLTVLCLVITPPKPIVISKPPYITQSVPYSIPKCVCNLDHAFRGWMNEIEMYDLNTYHVSATSSVFVTLEGSTLRLQTPRRNIPRRAVHGERNVQISNVIRQRLYDISKAKVYLVPSDLVKKRVWSKKYPICIEFSNCPAEKAHTGSSQYNEDTAVTSGNSNASGAYDIISEDDLTEKIFLFGRTQPQKEKWFYRFQRAVTIAQKKLSSASHSPRKETDINFIDNENTEIKDQQDSETLDDNTSGPFNPVQVYQKYYAYMCSLLPDPGIYRVEQQETLAKGVTKTGVDLNNSAAIHFSNLASQSDGMSDVIMSQPKPILGGFIQNEPGLDVAWFNVVVGRIMFDFLRLQKWADWVSNKLQKKLEKIRLPYFMEGLKLTEIDLGKTVPLVHKISLPRLDSEGIWLDMDITYYGAVQMTLETKLVLTRLGKQKTGESKTDRKSAVMNSDEEDSAESSEDEESLLSSSLPTYVQHFVPKGSENVPHGSKAKTALAKGSPSSKPSNPSTPTTEKRWVRIVDSITKSKYFQKVTETNYIKKKLETVSNTPLILTAELNQCHGIICINIPPPPSDRVWYGFKDHPTMVLKARPKLGERAVKATPITDWIEKKLMQEFYKVFLIPNMDDIPIPLMFNNLPSST